MDFTAGFLHRLGGFRFRGVEKSGEDTGEKEAAEGGGAHAACLAINACGEERRLLFMGKIKPHGGEVI